MTCSNFMGTLQLISSLFACTSTETIHDTALPMVFALNELCKVLNRLLTLLSDLVEKVGAIE